MSRFPIPDAALDDRLAVVGTAGSGKTYLTLGAIEHLLARRSRVIGIDPLGVMWGLRLLADGRTPSPFQPVIFGGAHGDLPINEHAGALIGEAVATSRDSCIIDLSQLGTKAAERRFMLAFLTALYRHTDKEPVHLVIDEADMFAPQKLLDKDGDAAKLLGMMETIVRRGRVKGFIPWLLTQRPAVLSKDVLSQADGIVALKLTAKQDHDAIGGWIEATADKGQWQTIRAALPIKQRGEGVVWIPARGILKEVVFPEKETFDSSRTPKRGERIKAASLKPIDLGALKDRLVAVEQDAKANDPRALKAEVARLTGELRKVSATTAQAKADPVAIEQADHRGYKRGKIEGYAAAILEIAAQHDTLVEDVRNAVTALGIVHENADVIQRWAMRAAPAQAEASPPAPPQIAATPPRAPVPSANGKVGPSARKILDVVHSSFPASLSFAAAAMRAGISKRSSAYRSYRSEVLGSGEVIGDEARLRSADGFAAPVRLDGDPVDAWARRLPPSYGNMLRTIAKHSHGADRETIATQAGISPTSSGLGSGLRELLDLELIQKDGNTYWLAEALRP